MATAGKLNGTLYKITVGATEIDNLTDNSVSFSVDTRDVTTKDSSGNRELLPTILSATYSGEAIVALDATYGAEELYDALVAKSAVTIEFTTNVSGDVQWSQSGYFTSVEIGAPMEDNVSVSFTIEGTGAITKANVT